MSTNNFIFKNRIYRGGTQNFITYPDISSNIPLSQLVQTSPISVMTLLGSNLGIGTNNPQVALDTNRTDAYGLPSGSNIDRPVGRPGMIRFNNEILNFEGYTGNQWISLSGLQNEAGDTYIIPEYSALLDDKTLHFYTQNIESMTLNQDGNLGIGTVTPRQKVDVMGNVYIDGNIGIGTTIPLKPLHVQNGAVFLNGNVGVGVTSPEYNLEIGGSLRTDTLYTTNVSISNLTISGSSFLQEDTQYFRNNISLKPIHFTEKIIQARSLFSTTYTGLYQLLPEKVEVYQNGHKLAYISEISKDYDVSYCNDTIQNKSTFMVTVSEEPEAGDVIDIVFWPTYLNPEGLLQPGYTVQDIQYSYWLLYNNGSNIHFNSGNVGIGTNLPEYTLDVKGDGYITDIFTSNVQIGNTLQVNNAIGIQTQQPVVSLDIRATDAVLLPKGTTEQRPSPNENGFIRYNIERQTFEGYSTSGWVTIGSFRSEDDGTKITPEYIPGSNDQAIRFYTNSNLQMILNPYGNLGIGTDNPTARLDVNGNALISNNLYVANTLQTSGNIQAGNVNISGTLITDQEIIASNMFIYGKLQFGDASSNVRSKLQQEPIRKIFYVSDLTQDIFTMTIDGMYSAEASNVMVYVQRNLLSYYSESLKDYSVSYSNYYTDFNTIYNIRLETPAAQGDLVDITLFPQLIEIETPIPGYVYQQIRITDTFFRPFANNVAYLGNVGIGTTDTREKLVVAGNIVPSQTEVYNLGSSNLRFKDLYLSGNTINLGGSLIQRNSNNGVIEFKTEQGNPVDTRVNTLYVTSNVGIGTTIATQKLHIQNGNALVFGNIGIGTTAAQSQLHVVGNILHYGTIVSSNLANQSRPALTIIQPNSNQNILTLNNTIPNTSNQVMTVDARGNLRLYGNNVNIGQNASPVFTPSGFIGQENLYTWWGDNTIVDAGNNSITPKEPFWKVFTGFTSTSFSRITPVGSALLGNPYYNTKWNYDLTAGGQYMIQTYNLNIDNQASITIPTNYILFKLPIKPNNSHQLFLKFICNDRWSCATVFVTNAGRTSFHRLHAQSTTTYAFNTNGATSGALNTSLIGPNGEMSSASKFHEWVMFSIPQYVIDEYAYDELYDNKSRYRKNIHLCLISGTGNGEPGNFWMTGIAMRTNPYGLSILSGRSMSQIVNGGSGITWDNNSWNYEGLARFDNTTYNNIRIPICPPKNPNGNVFPDFYLVWIGYESNPYGGIAPYISLQNPNDANDRQLLGRFSKCIKGRYGNFLSEQYRVALGLIVPSPDPRFVIYIGGQPYLNLYVDNVSFGLGGVSYLRGMFTEVIDPRGPNPNLTAYTNAPISWVSIAPLQITNYLSVSSGLTLYLDPEMYDVNSTLWRDFSGNYYDFTVSPNAFRKTNDIKHFDFEGSYGIAKRVINGSMSDVPRFNNATLIMFSSFKVNSTNNWRTLLRAAVNSGGDHQVITFYAANTMGMYDATVGWLSTGFEASSIPSYTTQFNMLVWKFASDGAPYYQFMYNLNDQNYTINSSSASFVNGFAAIGGYHSDSINVLSADQYWGKMGLILYYNRHLSTDEIVQVYNNYYARFNLPADIYPSSYNFRISHPDGRTFKRDTGSGIIRLNSGSDFTFDIYKSTDVYNSTRNRYALQQAGTNTYFNHNGFICRNNTGFASGNLNYSWSFVPNSNNGYQILNDYAGEYYLGYDSPSDQILIVEAVDTRRINFWNISPSIKTINQRMPLYYPMDSLSAPARTTLRGAYSVKRLSINYTGPMVKIRRSTDNVTLDFYSDQYGNLGTSNNSTGTPFTSWIGAGTGFVDTWYDQSGSNNHATQATTSIQPVLRPQGYLIDFLNTSTVFMNIPSGTVPVGALNLRYTFVVKHGQVNNTTSGGLIGSGGAAISQANNLRLNSGTGYWNYWYGNDYGINGAYNRGNVVSVWYNGVNRAGWVNNSATAQATATSYTNAAGPQYLGKTIVNEYLNGELHNVFIFGTALSDADRNICEEIL